MANQTIAEHDDNISSLTNMGPFYRHDWNPSEQPLGILGVAMYKNTLLHAVKIAPTSISNPVSSPQAPEELHSDVNSSNIVMVRAHTMNHTFPELTIKYYESKVKFVNKAIPPQQVGPTALREEIILTNNVGDTEFDCNLEHLSANDKIPTTDNIDLARNCNKKKSQKIAMKRRSTNDASDNDKMVKKKTIKKKRSATKYISSSSSDEDSIEYIPSSSSDEDCFEED